MQADRQSFPSGSSGRVQRHCATTLFRFSQRIRTLLAVGAMLLLGACACPRTTVVLLPDTDDHVGKIALSNTLGTTVMDQANQTVTLRKQSPPGEPSLMDPEAIQKRFAPVLEVEPLPPARFILQFESGSDVLLSDSLARIPDIVEAVEKRNSMDISVAGHSDRVGDEAANIALSLKRAQRVQQLLVERGIDPKLIHASSHGEGNPLIPTADGVPEPRNRRVEIIVR